MRHWDRRGARAWLLWPVSLLFRGIAATRRLLYLAGLMRREGAGVPVVVVGNLTAGGSGKTPLVLHVVGLLRDAGWHPGIVSRGHVPGRAAEDPPLPRQATLVADPAVVGDEPILLARRSGCPVWVCADRVAACRALRASDPGCDVIVADDGLQHYALDREVEICVLDPAGLGNRWSLPAGPLREPLSRLRSVDAVVVHGEGELPGSVRQCFRMTLSGSRLINLVDASLQKPAASFSGARVHAVAGIGRPERFFTQLAGFGIQVLRHPFPDHHAFRREDLDFGDGLPVVMTEKDAVKCKGFLQAHHWVFPVEAVLDPAGPAFGPWLLERLGGPKAA